MCGIVGFVSGFTNGFTGAEAQTFQDMLFLDTLRGWDSTGIFAVDKLGNVQIHKDALHGPDFLCTKQWADTKTEAIKRGKILVGHNRAATRGDVTDVNAHPFVVNDELVLVHNGSMKGSHKDLADVAVDSHAIAIHIEKNESLEKALQEINSAYALAWYRVSNKTLNLLRNDERPLWIVKTEQGGYVFASEVETILYACSRNNIKLAGKVEMIPKHVLTTIVMKDNGGVTFDRKEIDAAYRYKHTNYPTNNLFQNRQGNVGGFPPGHNVTVLHPTGRHRHYGVWGSDDDWEGETQQRPAWMDEEFNNEVIESTLPVQAPGSYRPGARDLNLNFVDYACTNLDELFLNPTQAVDTHDRMMEAINTRKAKNTFIVEASDYIKANTHKQCTTWIVYGSILTHEEKDLLSNIAVYWFVYGLSEEEILQYTTKGFYRVNITTVQQRTTLDKDNKRAAIVTGFGTEATYYPISTAISDKVGLQ